MCEKEEPSRYDPACYPTLSQQEVVLLMWFQPQGQMDRISTETSSPQPNNQTENWSFSIFGFTDTNGTSMLIVSCQRKNTPFSYTFCNQPVLELIL